MRDHIQYHNPVKNPSLDHQDNYFGIYTRKAVTSGEGGDRVWVITSDGSPRRYYVVEWFIVDQIDDNMPLEENIVSGRKGRFFRELIRIDDKSWFPDFLKTQGNFGRGFSPITDSQFVRGLETAARAVSPPAGPRRRAMPLTDGAASLAVSRAGQGFGDPLTNPIVERAAVAFVTREYEGRGWNVLSVEAENRGFDLECSSGRQREHVEIKGIQGTTWSFMLTANEHRAAGSDPAFVLIAVTDALGSPTPRRFTGSQLLQNCVIEPISFRVRVRETRSHEPPAT